MQFRTANDAASSVDGRQPRFMVPDDPADRREPGSGGRANSASCQNNSSQQFNQAAPSPSNDTRHWKPGAHDSGRSTHGKCC